MDTIFARCSGFGKAGVAIYRISGPGSFLALEKLIGHSVTSMQPRKMYFRKIFSPETSTLIDQAMVVYFNAESGFTGEETVEVHAHGGIAVMKMLNQALLSLPELRPAEPGEFARRAFLNGKFDLTGAEGLVDLIDAETELQHKQAIRQLSGGLEELYTGWRSKLLKIMGLIEAYIDFPDEDIPPETLADIQEDIGNLRTAIEEHLKDNNRGERLRNGLKLVIVGQPNVGKSSLMNFLLKREVSIVSGIAGTTRDVIEGHLDIGGYPVTIQDTAGIRDSSLDEVEQIGIKKAKEVLAESDIKIIMYDATAHAINEDFFGSIAGENAIVVLNKIDQARGEGRENHTVADLKISVKTGENLDQLVENIRQIAERLASPSEHPQITRQRHRTQLLKAFEMLKGVDLDKDLILLAEDIRMTARHLGSITGVITVDEILGEIFSSFCIGK